MSKVNEEQRLAYLIEKDHHLVTLFYYIGEHIVLFIGNYPNPNDPYHNDAHDLSKSLGFESESARAARCCW